VGNPVALDHGEDHHEDGSRFENAYVLPMGEHFLHGALQAQSR